MKLSFVIVLVACSMITHGSSEPKRPTCVVNKEFTLLPFVAETIGVGAVAGAGGMGLHFVAERHFPHYFLPLKASSQKILETMKRVPKGGATYGALLGATGYMLKTFHEHSEAKNFQEEIVEFSNVSKPLVGGGLAGSLCGTFGGLVAGVLKTTYNGVRCVQCNPDLVISHYTIRGAQAGFLYGAGWVAYDMYQKQQEKNELQRYARS